MVLKPHSREDLRRNLADASNQRMRIAGVDLQRISSLVEHNPEDMTATVEAGMALAAFQQHLGRAGQWLPIDPPNAQALTIGDLLAYDASGPRRFGYGIIRDYLIGIKVALANGQLIKAGGKVVKNVAGYDLCKLFIGAKHSLGIIVEATFKLRPLPEKEVILMSSFDSLAALRSVARALLEAPIEPVIFDAHNLEKNLAFVVAFAGSREDVEYQIGTARKSGPWIESSTAYHEGFARANPALRRVSVLPSGTADALAQLPGAAFVARFGNGIIYHNGQENQKLPMSNEKLMERAKSAYDPNRIFPDYTL